MFGGDSVMIDASGVSAEVANLVAAVADRLNIHVSRTTQLELDTQEAMSAMRFLVDRQMGELGEMLMSLFGLMGAALCGQMEKWSAGYVSSAWGFQMVP